MFHSPILIEPWRIWGGGQRGTVYFLNLTEWHILGA